MRNKKMKSVIFLTVLAFALVWSQDCLHDDNAYGNNCGSMCISTCKNPLGNETACPDMCVKGCFCKNGYVLDQDSNTCINDRDCPQTTTPAEICDDENASRTVCGSYCIETCQNPLPETVVCPAVCRSGCFCNEGYILNEKTNLCVKREECPAA